MVFRRPPLVALALFAASLAFAASGESAPPSPAAKAVQRSGVVVGSPIGVDYLRALGPDAGKVLAPGSGLVGALVALPKGTAAEQYGLEPVAPGIARIRGSAKKVEAWGVAHPDLHMEIAPPLHPLLDKVGQWIGSTTAHQRGIDGRGVMVGVADTGLDVTHAEMRDANGKTRVAWMLDLSLEPLGIHSDLENKFGLRDDNGNLVAGAVFSSQMIDSLLTRFDKKQCVEDSSTKCAPSDEIGHGTHVTGIAAARGENGKYVGIAPAADIVFVRVTRGTSDGIENDDLVRAVQFMFDRADAEGKPMISNLSLGSDFGPHDGTFLWEQAIAQYVGPDKPGHAIVAAAGNSGSVVETPIHQSVHVTEGARMRVPVTAGPVDNGSVQIWVTLRAGADVKIGLDGPDGEWIAPIASGTQAGKNTDAYNAGVIYGAEPAGSPIPKTSHGAVVVWQGKWPVGPYYVTFEGSGVAELYLQGLNDAGLGGPGEGFFTNGVREGTINLPATHPNIIGVGCTVNRRIWVSQAGAEVGLKVPLLDEAGGLAAPRTNPDGTAADTYRDLFDGELCWFSSAGPTATGIPKPEIAAPGALVVSAMSRNAKPGTPGSVFTNPSCPSTKSGKEDSKCLQIDDDHAIAVGTSMSSPVVAGVVALLLQQDPTLTQDKVLALIQAGAHRFRGEAPFDDQSGPGEVDAMGALDALEQMKNGVLLLPDPSQSWLTLSEDYVAADGSTPLTAIVELRTTNAERRADLFDIARLQPVVLVDGRAAENPPQMIKRGPGVYFFVWTPPPGLGGSRATFGATFDGQPVVSSRTIPIAADGWNATYPSHAGGSGCNMHGSAPGAGAGLLIAVAALFVRRRRYS
jgi:MYXO-CTERM domain-containing protein